MAYDSSLSSQPSRQRRRARSAAVQTASCRLVLFNGEFVFVPGMKDKRGSSPCCLVKFCSCPYMPGMRTKGLRQRARLKRTAIHLLPQFEPQAGLEMPLRIQPARHLPEGGIAKRTIRRTGRILTAFELFL